MTAPRSHNKARPFGPDELDGVSELRPDELAAETRLARDLEAIAIRDGIIASAGFADRVMGAVALEPLPAPAIAARSALRHAALFGFLVSVRDAFRVMLSGGFPMAVRAQAFALVVVVAGVATGSGYATAGAFGLLGDRPSPSPSTVAPTVDPTTTPGPSVAPETMFETPSPSPEPSMSPSEDPSETPEATEEPGETPEPDGNGGDGASTGNGSVVSSRTPMPTAKATAKPRPRPTPTPRPTPKPTPSPTSIPDPTETPDESDTHTPTPTPVSPTPVSPTPEH